jgi:riboflavin synthase
MFTGIVERLGLVVESVSSLGGKRLVVDLDARPGQAAPGAAAAGESIAVSGVCLTVVKAAGSRLYFDVVPETLSKTQLGGKIAGSWVNIERSLAVGERFGGHYVTGHVDGLGEVLELKPEGDQVLVRVGAPPRLLDEMLVKGSIAVDGVSLTIVDVDRGAGWFSFAAIPHTLAVTTLGLAERGDRVNLETDAFGKWVLHGLRLLGEPPSAL